MEFVTLFPTFSPKKFHFLFLALYACFIRNLEML
ncbi:hypothetical protein SLEP1_g26916 [Rubroshorea leprosula]|uniref:Uncharacterized protein n=1 Tax=Rubroshorea leprosula TaxID=152421 RepID=A0AAV5JXC4_9ROSI|nr:hypothetical protein SLEP1_g26916 [Rubroshorea leprosula]